MNSRTRRTASVVFAAALTVAGCSSGAGGTAECDEVVTDLILESQEFLDALGERTTEEAPFISSVDWWLSEYSDIHLNRIRLFVSLSEGLSETDLDALASDIVQMDDVQSVRVVSRDEALAEMRVLFADQPDVLEHFEANPDSVPASLRIAAEEDHSSGLIDALEARSEVVQVVDDPVSVDDLTRGVELHGLSGPAFDQPMQEAAALGCSEDVLLSEMRARSEELVPHGTAGESFIRSITDH